MKLEARVGIEPTLRFPLCRASPDLPNCVAKAVFTRSLALASDHRLRNSAAARLFWLSTVLPFSLSGCRRSRFLVILGDLAILSVGPLATQKRPAYVPAVLQIWCS